MAAGRLFRDGGFRAWLHRPGSAAAGRALPIPCSRPQPGSFTRLETKPRGLCSLAALGYNYFLFFFVLPLAESKAGERGGGISILGLENPDLQSPAPPFSAPSRNGWRSFPNSQLPGRGKLPARPPGGGEGAGSAPRLPAGPKLSRRGAGLISRPLPRERLPLRQLGRGVRGK